MNLDEERTVTLTVAEIVLLRNALRGYVKKLQEYITEDLDNCEVAAAIVQERMISDAIEIFGKLCKEE